MRNKEVSKILNYFNTLSDDDLDLALQGERALPPQVLALLFSRASVAPKSGRNQSWNARNGAVSPHRQTHTILTARLWDMERKRQQQREKSSDAASSVLVYYMLASRALDALFSAEQNSDCTEDNALAAEKEENGLPDGLKTDFGAASVPVDGVSGKIRALLLALQNRGSALIGNGVPFTKSALPGFSSLIAG